ncbi:ABC transporter permease [Devosia ginsengisoli]|uniref:ABC transporter permease n=1 Tax=Devosia ginsengisoli TaxID=400770 RepID=UPI0026EDCFF5|nr:ABC transporter permease [Devosia ginsengisoli]MCR6670796.1 ABC transporter permease [Devosia ginsengisoli]
MMQSLTLRMRRTSDLWNRFSRRNSSVIGLLGAVFFLAVALFANWLAPYGRLEMGLSFQPPSPDNWLGTDSLGSDVLSSIIYGAQTSLLVGFCAVATSSVIGVVVGALSGYYGGMVDNVFMRITELFQMVPQFFLAIIIIALFGASIWNVIFVIGILTWPSTARLLRGEFLALKQREFIEAGRSLGMSDFDLIMREILPNALPPVIVNASLQISGAILLETSLSFLGLGDPNVMSWGMMLNSAQEYFNRAWWMAAFPGLAIFLTTLGLNLVGDGLNDALNPRLRT